MKATLFLGVVLAVLSPSLAASTWRVGGSGADFQEIDDALLSALDGDVILVRPGTYRGFALDQGVRIAASSTPFRVRGDVTIQSLSAGQSAAIARMTVLNGARFHLLNCAGEIVLDAVTLNPETAPSQPRMVIDSCTNVAATELRVLGAGAGRSNATLASLEIWDSSVRLADVHSFGPNGVNSDGAEDAVSGWDGMHIHDSIVEIAQPKIRGGNGGWGAGECFFSTAGNGANGGQGIVTYGNTMLLLQGDASQWVVGGKGGAPLPACLAGRGGWGVYGSGGPGTMLTSRIQVLGGLNAGPPPVRASPIVNMNQTQDDLIPDLTISGTLLPGSVVSLHLQAWQPGQVLFITSDRGGFTSSVWAGPRFALIPGSLFLSFFASTGAGDRINLQSTLPTDPGLRGQPVHVQSLLFPAAGGRKYLSNAIVRVVGE